MENSVALRKKGKWIKALKKNLFVYSLIIYPIFLWIIFYVITNFNSIILAFQKIDGTGKSFYGLNNFKLFIQDTLQEDSILNYALINSLKFYLVELIICLPLNIIFSYLLFKKCFLNKAVSFLIMLPSIMSGLVISLIFINFIGSSGPFTWIVEKFNINGGEWFSLLYTKEYALNTCIFYSIWLSFTLNLIIYPNAMRAIEPSILESARIDGVTNMFQELWWIIIPLIYPTITTFLILGVSGIFSATGPLIAFYDTNAPDEVYTMGYYFTRQVLVDSNEFSYPKYAAGGLILTLVSAPLTLFVKWILEKFEPTAE